jgi:site-specific DNA-methyltransferase (adenine-specific)
MHKIEDIIDTIMCCDVLEGLRSVPDDSVHLIVSSPPYNVNLKGYGNRDDNQPYESYLKWIKDIFLECKRILVKGGRLAINIDAMTNRQEDSDEEYIRPIYADLINIGRDIDLCFRAEYCWYKQNVVGRKTAWGSYDSCSNPICRRNHEYILVWSKDQWRLDGDADLSDMTAKEFQEWTMSTWFIQPETRNHNNHPAPYPEELVNRIVKLYSYRGNIVLDPFMGTGTTGFVCKMINRRYIGIDNSISDVNYARQRIASRSDIFDNYISRSDRMKLEKQEKTENVIENKVF